MASGRYIDMEKTERLKREAEAAKAANKDIDKKNESDDNKKAGNLKSKLDIMRKAREKAIAPPKDL